MIRSRSTRSRPLQFLPVLLTVGLFITTAAYAATIYVDDSNTSGVEDGSQANPYNTVQEGVDAASDGDTVSVASGTYDEAVTVVSRSNLTVQGQGAGTILQSAQARKITISDSSGITVKDLSVQGGQQGISIGNATDIGIENNTFSDIIRFGYHAAGALLITYSEDVRIDGNSFDNCYGGQYGGAGYVYRSDLDVRNNSFINCRAWNMGGGFYIYSGGSEIIDISGNYFDLNTADNSGAIDIRGYGNAAVTIDHNIIVDSGADYKQGGAIRCELTSASATVDIVNNVISDVFTPCCTTAKAVYLGGAASIYAVNNIIANSTYAFYSTGTSNVLVEYNDTYSAVNYGPVTIGAGNISADPLFADASGGDYSLTPNSPCIDAGHPDPQYNDPDGSRNDMGAFGGNVGPGVTADVYVDAANTTGVEDGSEANPYNTIQEGVNVAADGETIGVAAGTYVETVSINGRSGLTLIGNPGATVTRTGTGYKFDIRSSSDITVDGFIIEGGEDGNYIVSSTDITFTRNTIRDITQYNYSYGGAFLASSSEIYIHDNVIQDCWGGQYGGAGYIISCDGEITCNTVIDCRAWNRGGGFWVYDYSAPTAISISENYFEGCLADYSGAIHLQGKNLDVLVNNNIIKGSGSDYSWAGAIKVEFYDTSLASADIINNVIADTYNPCCAPQVGIYVRNRSTVYAANNIITGGGYAIYNASVGVTTAEYNDAYGTSYGGSITFGPGGISLNPLFVDAANGDYSLQAGSPCINAGHPSAVYNDNDGSRNDMGAFGGIVVCQ